MNRIAKITQLLKLAGVAPHDFDAARKNYDGLDEADVDRRLARLEKGAEKVRIWRSHARSLNQSNSVRNIEVLASVKTSLETVEKVDNLLENLARAIPAKEPRRIRLTGLLEQFRYVASTLKERATGEPTLEDFLKERLETIAGSNYVAATIALHQLENILDHPILPSRKSWLSATDTVDAIARIENAIALRIPDLIIAVNEGLPVALLIKTHLRLDAPIVTVHGSVDSTIRWPDPLPKLEPSKNVWVIGHVAKTAGTLLETIRQASRLYRTTKVFGAVLAASVEAADNLSAFSFHQLAETSIIGFGFDTSKELQVEGDNFILGSSIEDESNIFAVSRGILNRARLDMARIHPVSLPANKLDILNNK